MCMALTEILDIYRIRSDKKEEGKALLVRVRSFFVVSNYRSDL